MANGCVRLGLRDRSHDAVVTSAVNLMLTLLQVVDKFGAPTFVSRAARIVSPQTHDTTPMSSRILILALCIAAIALACGPRAHNEAASPKKTRATVVQAGSTARPVASSTKRNPEPQITVRLAVHAQEASVRFALHVQNAGKKRVELTFPSGQTYDFVVVDSIGRELWRWGAGRMFTQALRNTLLGAGETLDIHETWRDAPLPPGRYVAKAVLASENFPIVQQMEFIVNGTTVASR
jgi:hypothetical protein